MKWIWYVTCIVIIGVTIGVASTSIVTQGYDNTRPNAITTELLLTPTNVSNSFGLLGTYSIPGTVFAQPLVFPYVISNAKNIVIAVDALNNVAAFDADRPGTASLWKTNVGATAALQQADANNFNAVKGIVSPPVVDIPNGWIFILSAQTVTGTNTWLVEKLSISTGSVITSTVISGSYPGTGSGVGGECTSGSNVLFCYTASSIARSGLALFSGKLYLTFSQADVNTWHGWVITYNESLVQQNIWLSTPNGNGGAIWSAAPVIDTNGDVYLLTGNGTYDGSTNYAMSLVRLNSSLVLVDWYTPTNYASLSSADADLSSGAPILITSSKIIFGAKDWVARSLVKTCLGQLGGTVNGCTPQTWSMPNVGTPGPNSGIFTAGVFMNNTWYLPTNGSNVYAFSYSGTSFTTTPLATSAGTFALHGLIMTGSSNGVNNGIIWGVSQITANFNAPVPGKLTALKASDLSFIWDSTGKSTDALGSPPKLTPPTVANSNVYAAIQGGVAVYGLYPKSSLRGVGTLHGVVKIH